MGKEIIIDGVVYVPKEVKKDNNIMIKKEYHFELHPEIKENLDWTRAKEYVKSLGDEWRLPTIEECFIIYQGKHIDNGYYWSITEYDTVNAWYFFFTNGVAYFNNKDYTTFVRAVRDIKNEDN
jgi:hypothetical protein